MREHMGAKFPGGQYRHQYGDLLVTVESRHGVYVATVRRPSDGYEVTIETPERHPGEAARYALGLLAHGAESENVGLRRAAEEIGQEANEALTEDTELSGSKRDGGNMKVYVVEFCDGNTMCGEGELYIHATAKGADERIGKIVKENLKWIGSPETKSEIIAALEKGDVDTAYDLFSGDGGPTGLLVIQVNEFEVGK